ncbi:S4 domain-containing protein [Mycoplasma sp. VS509_3]|uniref:S4 domain-containing protein n=1 Tax=Mycoplasma sp. VS509_3 TaxID=3401669 RepID=UPI003AAD66BC
MEKKIRLDKFLAQCLGLTRSQATKLLKSKLVTLNGQIITNNLDINANDIVSYQGQELSIGPKFHYYVIISLPDIFVPILTECIKQFLIY